MEVDVGRHISEEDAGDTAAGEVEDDGQGEQHRRPQPELAHPDGAKRAEEDQSGGDGDQLRGDEERPVQVVGHARGEHVVRPDDTAQAENAEEGGYGVAVGEQGLAGKVADDLQRQPEARQDHDVDRGV